VLRGIQENNYNLCEKTDKSQAHNGPCKHESCQY